MKFNAQTNLKFIALASLLALVGCNSSDNLSGPSSSDETTIKEMPLTDAQVRAAQRKRAEEARRKAVAAARRRAMDNI